MSGRAPLQEKAAARPATDAGRSVPARIAAPSAAFAHRGRAAPGPVTRPAALARDLSRISVLSRSEPRTPDLHALSNRETGSAGSDPIRNQDAGVRPPAAAPPPTPSPSTPPQPRGPNPVPSPGGSVRPPVVAAPPVPATAVIAPVVFLTSPNRVAPRRSATVAITLAGIPARSAVSLDVEGSGGPNGTATVLPGSLSASGPVAVRGDAQTAPGNAGNLRVRATLGGAVIGRSAGFTVAAWPRDFSTSRVSDIDTTATVGVVASNAWVSDSGTLSDLDQVTRTERVDLARQDNPPFGASGGVSAGAGTGTSGHRPGTSSPRDDHHGYPRAGITTAGLAQGFYFHIFRQNFLFNDARTGTIGAVAPNSGFVISHGLTRLPMRTTWTHLTTKTGSAVTVEGRATTAGSGTATSDAHTI